MFKNKMNRRTFLELLGFGAAGLPFVQTGLSQSQPVPENMLLYVGTYTEKGSEGIYVYDFNSASGSLSKLHTVKGVVQPSYLAINKSRTYLYAVNELVEYEGKKSGSVSSFAIDQRTGDLTLLNKQPSMGDAPCHISVSNNEKFVLVANYLGGNVSVYLVESGGKLGSYVELVQHAGSGPNKARQESPHAHSISLDHRNRFAVAADLGIDKVLIYKFDAKTGKLTSNPAQPFFQTKGGSGPRHFAFHQNGRSAFVINELASSITAFSFDENMGALTELQTISTLPEGYSGSNTCADIRISPNGRFLYGSNRGHDSLASYQIDTRSGRLGFIEHTSTGGKTPRNFTIAPNGKFLLAANQNSDSIVVFKIDEKTGKLMQTENRATVSMPVCLKLIPRSAQR
jgi:6-phosphogluconolactonase